MTLLRNVNSCCAKFQLSQSCFFFPKNFLAAKIGLSNIVEAVGASLSMCAPFSRALR